MSKPQFEIDAEKVKTPYKAFKNRDLYKDKPKEATSAESDATKKLNKKMDELGADAGELGDPWNKRFSA